MKFQDVLALLLRILTLLVLTYALTKPAYVSRTESSELSALVDISESLDEAVGEKLLTETLRFDPPQGALSLIPFAGESASLSQTKSTFHSLKRGWSRLNTGKTNLELALQSQLLGERSKVLLVSDGFETAGDIERALPGLQGRGIQVFPIVPAQASQSGSRFRIVQLDAPLVAPADKSVDINVAIANTTGSAQTGLLRVVQGEKEIFSEKINIASGEAFTKRVASDPTALGIKEVRTILTPEDSAQAPSEDRLFISAEEREKIVLLSGSAADESLLSRVLNSQGYRVEARVVEAPLGNLPDLSHVSVLALNNVAHRLLPAGAGREITQYVEGGGTLLMIGGNSSFGLGGYIGTDIEPLLPVSLLPPQAEQKRLNVAVELLLDKSRSMLTANKLEFAKEAAAEVIRNLKDEDYVGVIGFDTVPFEVVRLDLLRNIREQAIDRLRRLIPAEKTNLLPAIDDGRRRLSSIEAGRKHMIILTDGRLPDGGPYYVDIVKQLRMVGITVSTVLVGDGGDDGLLHEMAEVGGGAYYQTNDPHALPKIFIADMKVASGERTMKEQEDFSVRLGPGPLLSTTQHVFPELKGYVQTRPREDSALELVVMADGKADPLLASRTVGQGRSIAFTSDANGRWSAPWVRWDGFVPFWSEVLEGGHAQEKPKAQKLSFDLRHEVNQDALHLDLAVFADRDPGAVKGTLIGPDGRTQSIGFEARAPGNYDSRVEGIQAGKYELRLDAAGQALTPVAFYLSGDLFGEKKGKGFNIPLLSRLASQTGGAINPDPDTLKGKTSIREEKTDLVPYLLGLALLLFALEIFVREVGFRRRKWIRV